MPDRRRSGPLGGQEATRSERRRREPKCYIISDGHVLAEGTPAEIVNNADVRRVYLGEHFRM